MSGGLKFLPSEIERAALDLAGVEHARAEGRANPITGQHVELTVQPVQGAKMDPAAVRAKLAAVLPEHMQPRRVRVKALHIGHRFKKL